MATAAACRHLLLREISPPSPALIETFKTWPASASLSLPCPAFTFRFDVPLRQKTQPEKNAKKKNAHVHLQRRRHLQQLHEATRLSFVMMLVGSRRDPPVASRAIATMLVDHWCDKGPCSFLQKVGCAGRKNVMWFPEQPACVAVVVFVQQLFLVVLRLSSPFFSSSFFCFGPSAKKEFLCIFSFLRVVAKVGARRQH